AQVALDSVGDVPSALAAATQIAILRDDAARAAELSARLRRLAPGSRAALEASAAYASDVAGDHTEARRLLVQAIELDPERAFLWNALGLEEDALDHPLEAEAAFRRALALEPGNPAAMGNLAVLLLDLERVEEARALAEALLRRDPASYLGLRVKGRADLQSGDPGAQTALMRALAAQPAAAETSIALGIAAYMNGDRVRGAQEMDAAGRLDPNDPMVPLVRAITALDENRIDDAITAGRQAADLFERQESSGRVVSADRQTGSALVGAYGAIGLEGWARYAADRTYDPLSAASLFSEGYLDRLSLGRDGPSSDGYDGSVVNGLLLEPLSASYRLRFTDILRRPFTDVGVSVDVRKDEVVSGLELQGFARTPQPLAYALTLSGVDTTGQDGRDRLRSGQLLAATQWGARGGGFVTLGRTETHSRTSQLLFPGLETLEDTRVTSDSAVLGGHVRLNERAFLVFFLGHARRESDATLRDFTITPASVFRLDTRGRQDVRSDRLNIGYQAEDESGFWTAGLELGRVAERSDSALTVTDLLTGANVTLTDATRTRTETARAYVGRRQRLGDGLAAEGLLTLDRVGGDNRPGGRIGIAWSPAEGHWLRAALIADGNPQLSSLVPASVLGLVPLRLPYRADGRLSGVMARYDVEVTDRLLVGVEHQRLDLRNLSYATANPAATVDADRARLSATSLRADWWIGGGVGLAASLTHADSRMRDGPFAGAALPYVPDWTARAGLGWLRPGGFGGGVSAVWTGRQFAATPAGRLDPVLTVDAALSYETRNKRLAARLEVTNLFDRPVDSPWGGAPTGREVRLSLSARF
uniref:TonB-dependent receptor domain-containing protein n=1 Tax=Oceaniglobus roseus TaxID=1737570 RepID=UPI00130012A0